MSRRANNEGSIHKRERDGRWVATILVGYAPSGKPIRKTYVSAKRGEVAEKLKEAMRQHDLGVDLTTEDLTVEAYLLRWLDDAARPTVKESTYMQYRRTVKNHIIPALGRSKLKKLTAMHLNGFYREKLETGLAPATVLYMHRVIHKALAQADRWALVVRNVADLVDPPRVAASTVAAFSLEQARAFLVAVRGDRLEALYVVALSVGLRRGEVLALRWEDIDLTNATMSVRRTLTKVEGGWAFAEPKTPSSRRNVKLPAFVVNALDHHKDQQKKEREDALHWSDPGLVFCTEIGTVIDGRNLLAKFKGKLKAAGLKPDEFTFHGLRHSAATLMLALGVQPKVVQETLGHSRIAVTIDLYSHVLPHLQDEAAAKMDALLG
jgi:integrase